MLEQRGIASDVGPDGKAHAVCPFHADTKPSFDVWGENFERWGCFPCGAGGDVLDLIQRFDHSSFADALQTADAYLLEIGDWAGPRHGEAKQPFDLAAARDFVWGSQVDPGAGVDAFLRAKGLPLRADWLQNRWGVGSAGAEVVIPYKDPDGELVAYKYRTVESKPIAAAGAVFDVFYGEWLDRDSTKPVLLAEGESDVWVTDYELGSTYAVLGLPTGTGTKTALAARLAGRSVTLGFDGDVAGRKAARTWTKALLEQGCQVAVLRLPDGKDLASVGDIGALPPHHVSVPPNVLLVQPTGYARIGRDVHTPISNWVFEPARELVGEEASAWEGTLHPHGTPALLHADDLSSKAKLVRWASGHGGNWEGSDKDAQTLLGMIQAEAPYLAPGSLTSVVGWHDDNFVYPGGSIGPDHWVYADGNADGSLDISIAAGEWGPGHVSLWQALHDPWVMDPLLAWLAAAPIRACLREFPVLAVMGSSGSGKTTLLNTLLPAFSGSLFESNLTSTTPFSVAAFAEATNGIPLWFDEFRPGARTDALDRLKQVLRDAYTAQKSSRGGTRERWSQVVSQPASAPIIVSGEDAFFETSHTDRMVLLSLPLEGRNSAALDRVRDNPAPGFAHAYISWLVGSIRAGSLGASLTNYEYGPARLRQRVRINLGVLHLGWTLLTEFLAPYGLDLADPDFSLVIAEADDATNRSPIEEGIIWALGQSDGASAVTLREGAVLVDVVNLVNYLRKSGFQLPGNQVAVEKHLIQAHGAQKRRESLYVGGPMGSLLVVPSAFLNRSE